MAFENLDPILERARSKGVDMTQWGPADFSFSMGDLGLQRSPKIRIYEERSLPSPLNTVFIPGLKLAALNRLSGIWTSASGTSALAGIASFFASS